MFDVIKKLMAHVELLKLPPLMLIVNSSGERKIAQFNEHTSRKVLSNWSIH